MMEAKNLPPEIRQQLLSKIRAELGVEQYDLLVAKIGEDGLLAMLLNQVTTAYPKNQTSSMSPVAKAVKAKPYAKQVPYPEKVNPWAAALIFVIPNFIYGLWGGDVPWWLAILIAVMFFIAEPGLLLFVSVIYLLAVFYYAIRNRTPATKVGKFIRVVGVILAAAVIVGLGYVFYF